MALSGMSRRMLAHCSAGALLAGFIGQSLNLASTANGAGFIGAIIGAFVILLIYRLVMRRR